MLSMPSDKPDPGLYYPNYPHTQREETHDQNPLSTVCVCVCVCVGVRCACLWLSELLDF